MGKEPHISKAMIFAVCTYYMSQLNSELNSEWLKQAFDGTVQRETLHLSILDEN